MEFVAGKTPVGISVIAAVYVGALVVAIGGVLNGVAIAESFFVVMVVGGFFGVGAWGLFKDFQRDRQLQVRRHAIAAQKQREQLAAKLRHEQIEALGAKNSALLEVVEDAVDRIAASEAARAGWLGDVDFKADIAEISDNFENAHALRKVTDELSALSQPTADDRKILAEAQNTIANLERKATDHIALIHRCVAEAKLVDESLRQEQVDAKNDAQRAELHAKLSAMLYGIESLPGTSAANSSADALMARVQAYREIKSQVEHFR